MCVSDLLCVSQLKTNATQLLTFQVSFLTWIPPFCVRNAFYWLKRRIIPIAFVFVTFTTQKPQSLQVAFVSSLLGLLRRRRYNAISFREFFFGYERF